MILQLCQTGDAVFCFSPAAKRRRRAQASGFTLVEILVVAGIIAILIGILLPIISKANERAKVVQCQSNLRQIGQALFAYMDTNQNRLPPGGIVQIDLSQPPDADEDLPELLRPNIGAGTEIYHCPGDPVLYRTCGGSYSYYDPPEDSDSANAWYGEFYKQSTTLILASDFDASSLLVIAPDGTPIHLTIPPFHHTAFNRLYADMHVNGS